MSYIDSSVISPDTVGPLGTGSSLLSKQVQNKPKSGRSLLGGPAALSPLTPRYWWSHPVHTHNMFFLSRGSITCVGLFYHKWIDTGTHYLSAHKCRVALYFECGVILCVLRHSHMFPSDYFFSVIM
jgi:hypothetical protein